MRSFAPVVSFILLVCGACDNKQETSAGAAPSAATNAAPGAASPAKTSGQASAAPSTSAPKSGGAPMPERPVPKPQTMVASSAPIEQQQKAIGYMVAMRAPHPDDANAEPEYAKELADKLRPISLSMDSGPDKAKMNRVEIIANGRQIDMLMSGGCHDRTPLTAVVNRAGIPLATLASRGVFVVRCNDSRVQCLQSTRDPEDVLCTTAPRRR